MILITTAGKVGSQTARLLAKQGETVRVLIRDPEKASALARVGVEVAEGDLEVPAAIDGAMQGVSSVLLVSPAIPAQELNVVDSTVRAGVEHVVKITSKASADSPIARRRGQTEIENGLIASGLGYTLLRNNVYMQNFLMLAPAIAKTSSFGASTGDGRVGMIDTRDVAAIAAKITASPAPHSGKTYWLTGPERLSYPDAAAILSNVLGRPITFHPLTFEEQKQAMINVGVPEAIAEMNAQALSLVAEGDSDWITDDVPSLLGRPARGLNSSPPTTPRRSPEAPLAGPARHDPSSASCRQWRSAVRTDSPLASGSGGSRAEEWWLGGSEACDEDSGLPARELVPVSCVRERLGEHRSRDDDVDRGGVGSDGPLAASTGEDLLE